VTAQFPSGRVTTGDGGAVATAVGGEYTVSIRLSQGVNWSPTAGNRVVAHVRPNIPLQRGTSRLGCRAVLRASDGKPAAAPVTVTTRMGGPCCMETLQAPRSRERASLPRPASRRDRALRLTSPSPG
jgi:hypothetical protein